MKTTIIILSLLLTGCVLIPTPFDPVMYDRVVTLSTSTSEAASQCGSPAMQAESEVLKDQSKALMKYTEFASKDMHSSLAIVDKNITELSNAYEKGTPSTAYCKLKLTIINNDLDLILQGAGAKQ